MEINNNFLCRQDHFFFVHKTHMPERIRTYFQKVTCWTPRHALPIDCKKNVAKSGMRPAMLTLLETLVGRLCLILKAGTASTYRQEMTELVGLFFCF